MSATQIWRLSEVAARTGLSRSTIYQKMSKDEFPHSVNLGPRAVGWIADEVIEWITQQIEKSRKDDE